MKMFQHQLLKWTNSNVKKINASAIFRQQLLNRNKIHFGRTHIRSVLSTTDSMYPHFIPDCKVMGVCGHSAGLKTKPVKEQTNSILSQKAFIPQEDIETTRFECMDSKDKVEQYRQSHGVGYLNLRRENAKFVMNKCYALVGNV